LNYLYYALLLNVYSPAINAEYPRCVLFSFQKNKSASMDREWNVVNHATTSCIDRNNPPIFRIKFDDFQEAIDLLVSARAFHPLPLDRVDSIVISGSDRRGSPRHMGTKGAGRSDSARKFPSFRPSPCSPLRPSSSSSSSSSSIGIILPFASFSPVAFFFLLPSPPTRIFFNRKTSSG
jgi:hypothetical protein